MLYVQKLTTPGKECEILDCSEQGYCNIGSISIKYSNCGLEINNTFSNHNLE